MEKKRNKETQSEYNANETEWKRRKKKAREGNSNRKKKTGKEVTKTSFFFALHYFFLLLLPLNWWVMMRNSQPSYIFIFWEEGLLLVKARMRSKKNFRELQEREHGGVKSRSPLLVTPIPLYESSAKKKDVTELTWSNVCNHKGTKQILLRTSNVWQQQKAWQEEFS